MTVSVDTARRVVRPLVHRSRAFAASSAVVAVVLAASGAAFAQDEPGAGENNASCLGLGSSFYGQFAPQQRAFVALFVNDLEGVAGEYYVVFAQEKEGGTIPAPCGTRIE
jgi:hypothetical protein